MTTGKSAVKRANNILRIERCQATTRNDKLRSSWRSLYYPNCLIIASLGIDSPASQSCKKVHEVSNEDSQYCAVFRAFETGRIRGVIVNSLTEHRQEVQRKLISCRQHLQLLGNRLFVIFNKACRNIASHWSQNRKVHQMTFSTSIVQPKISQKKIANLCPIIVHQKSKCKLK